ncbi:MAG TPA: hypothetical protein VGU46_07765 [Acidobacteriaceae bacterium]|nr:hypothetical protein [Acidobacteriaceae bacterium]
MRRFVTLCALLLFAIPFGASISGCSKKDPVVFCNGGDSGPVAGQVSTITLGPITQGISLNYAQINQVSQPNPTDCKGQSAYAGAFTYGTTDMTIADVVPSGLNAGHLCAGTWNRNTGGGIPDYTVCNPTNKTGVAYISASAEGVTSNPLPVFVHPVVTQVIFGNDAPGSNPSTVPTAAVTAYSIKNNTPTFTGSNNFTAGQVVSLYSFPNSKFFNGISNAVILGTGLSATQFSVSIPAQSNPTNTIPTTAPLTLETGYAGPQDCTTNPTTSCCPLTTIGSVSAQQYVPTSCVSQGQTRQLTARVYAGTVANPVNISCQVGPLIYQAQSPASGTAISPVVSIDSNGVATANQPGSQLITAYVSTAASSAGFFSTCPPVSISLSAPGISTSGPIVVNQNNTQPLIATALDMNNVPITGLNLEYETTAPSTVQTAQASITPGLAGAASITAVCQPPACNPSAYNQIGLFGNGKPVTSNALNVVVPGNNSTVLYMASTQSRYMTARDFTMPSQSAALLLPYQPNSMVISTNGGSIYLGSSTALMVVNTIGSLSIARVDINSEGNVLAVSPDNSRVVISDPIKHTITIEDNTGVVFTTYGGVGTRAQFSPDSQTVYIAAGSQVLVYSNFTGWTSINPTTLGGTQANDVAITVPAVGAYFAGPTTTDVNYCSISTPAVTPGSETNVFYPSADNSVLGNQPIVNPVATDRIAATNDGKHILGATIATGPTLNDLLVQIPSNNPPGPGTPGGPGPGVSVACPLTGTLNFSNTVAPTPLSLITASAITGVFPTSDSSEAFITYTGSGKVLPAYAPAASGPGTLKYIPLSGTAIAPIAGVVSADNTTFYAGTSGDNLVHIINRSTLTDSGTLTPNLIDQNGVVVPVDLLAQRPRTSN